MTTQVRKNVMDMFIDGARRGFTIATTNLLPNVVMAFVIIQALKITGLLDWVGHICQPVMALWGLPGEAATVLLASLMSMGGAVGVAASLATAGALSGHDVTVLLPAIYLMGNPVQNVGRCLGTAEVNAKYYPHIIAVCAINALLSIWVMQLMFNKELSCLIYPPRSLPCYRVRTCLRQKTGASAMFYSRMAKLFPSALTSPAISYRTVR